MQLSGMHEKDIPLIARLRIDNVLKEINQEQLPSDGDEIIACADGERIIDLLFHHQKLCEHGRPCHHSLLLNGGPLLIPDGSPAARFGEGIIILEHAFAGQKLKKVKTIHLYGHWPCGAANEAGLSVLQCLTLLGQAKERTLDFFYERTGEHPKVIPLFHVHYVHEDGRRRSYYLDRHRFGEVHNIHEAKNWRSSRQQAA
jgi:hypothetical protein